MDHPVPETNLHSITSNYGFMMLFILIISYFLWKYFRSLYRNSSSSNNDTHRIAMEAARAKLQAEFNAEVAQYKSRKQEEMEGGKSNVSGSDHSEGEKKKRLRLNDYNPLIGDTGKTYKPTSRFCSRGG
ncbi:hypothetical protein EWB00_004894 [Schistosoma japonicum]|uniref:SJCHGC01429 protein n=1 Tax=Schistosoma japonicum TaxID=6182 RepID=Q5DAU7_SCHJA|nr:SJCHGC01429 protein [Schistosoma japonicum]KAH8849400.1 hypothetical protein KSF78_0000160 [Schistosoma japonicum]KAH8849401.1 hypothetical protein KSF78_0000160 [Schistosoma japonicum]KAH8849403.1 hypothetical protein KSF78_0000160 [Schistosoma japonicum]KAH8849404.1 hypothetical protein KSF78_0000160 [Schistosoma japonicum]